MHFRHPVAQRVGDELQHVRIAEVERVAAAGVVHIAATRFEAVIRVVVDAAQRQGRACCIALGAVVVDDVENDFETGSVQRLHHRLELVNLFATGARRRVATVWCEKPESVVAPVVRQAAPQQCRLTGEVVDRQQLKSRDAQLLQVVGGGSMREPGVGTAQFLRHVGVLHGEPAHVYLVKQCVGPCDGGCAVLTPVEVVLHHDRLGHKRCRVARVVLEHGVVELEVAVERAGVRIGDQLVVVEVRAIAGVEIAIDAIPVARSSSDAGQVAVPDVKRRLAQWHAGLGAVVVEHAQLDRGRVRGEQREVGATVIDGGTKRLPMAGPDVHRPILSGRASSRSPTR